ncbi:MAG: Ig-like domain-containing protein [Chloroflexi bacterium]|nr:Ig-like domain-containing protein [Chloroflexota bacterium]
MLELNQPTSFVNHRTSRLHRLGFGLLAATLGVLLLALFGGTASAQDGRTIGRGFTGIVTSVDTDLSILTVESGRAVFRLAVTDTTVINFPPDKNVGLAGLPGETGFKIAGLVEKQITDDEGNVASDLLNALKITVVPGKATRSHKRSIAAEKDGDDLTTLDDDGEQTELAGRGAGFEKGDVIVLLVQNPGRGGGKLTVKGLFKAKDVDARLERLTKAEGDNQEKAELLTKLRDKRDVDQEEQLQKTAEKAENRMRDFVLSKVRAMQEERKDRNARGGVGSAVSECARGNSGRGNNQDSGNTQGSREGCETEENRESADSPVVRITAPTSGTVVGAGEVVTVRAEAKDDVGVVSVTFRMAGSQDTVDTEAPYTVDVTIPTDASTVTIKAVAVDSDGNRGDDSITLRVAQRKAGEVGIKITSPRANAGGDSGSRRSSVSGSSGAITEGSTVDIRAEVTGVGAITVVFTINGVSRTPILAPPYAMTYLQPLAPLAEQPLPLKITATATDSTGKSAADSVDVKVVRKTTEVKVKITEPAANAKLSGGDKVVVRAATGDDSAIASVTFSVDGTESTVTTAPYSYTYVVPRKSSGAAAVSSVPPNIFTGTATLNGAPAPDDTVVIAWIAGSETTRPAFRWATLSIKVTATAKTGETGVASMSLPVSRAVNAGEVKVKNGKYTIQASQPSGQNFSGKKVTFTVGGVDAGQTGTWRQGDAIELNLNASSAGR